MSKSKIRQGGIRLSLDGANEAQILPNCHNGPNSQKVLEIRPISLFLCTFYASLWPKIRLPREIVKRLPREIAERYLTWGYLTGVISAIKIRVNPWLINDLHTYKALYNCKETFTDVMKTLQIKLFMQNKAKFRKVKLNVNNVLTRDYDIKDTWSSGKKQSQTNPNKAKFKKTKMNVTSIITKGYENKPPIWAPKKQSQTSKRQKPMQTSLTKGIMNNTAFSGSDKTKPIKANFKGALTR